MLKRKPFWLGVLTAALLVITGIALTVLTEWRQDGIEFSWTATPTPDPVYEALGQYLEQRDRGEEATVIPIAPEVAALGNATSSVQAAFKAIEEAEVNPIFKGSMKRSACNEMSRLSTANLVACLEWRVEELERAVDRLNYDLYGPGNGY